MNRWLWRAFLALASFTVLASLVYYAFFTQKGQEQLRAFSGGNFDSSTVAAWVATEVSNLGLEVPEEAPTLTPTPTQKPTGTPTPTRTPEPTQTPTPKSQETPTDTADQAALVQEESTQEPQPTPTDETAAEQEAFMEDVQELQDIFRELAAKYPEGFDGRLVSRADFVGMPGIDGLARAGLWVLEDMLKNLDPSLELWLKFRLFFKEHPDAILVYVMESNRPVWCREKWNDFTCQFAPHSVRFAGWARWHYGQLALGGGMPLDKQTEALSARAGDWTDTGLIGGRLPGWDRYRKGYRTQWNLQVYIVAQTNAIPLFGLTGNTWDAAPYGEGKSLLKGELDIIAPEDLAELDVAIQQAIIEEYASR